MLTYQTYIYWRRTVTALARIVIVAALLVNIALPFLDHHYVERLPAHEHIYFEGFTAHTHEFENVHRHYPVPTSPRISSLLESQGRLELVILDSRDIGYSHSHTLPVPHSPLLSNFSRSSYPLLNTIYTNTNLTRAGTIISPPYPPPKL